MNEQSAFIINEESYEKIVKENEEEKRKELIRKIKTNARQRAYYQRQKGLKKNEEKKRKKKETVPKSNAERQRKFRQHNAEKSYMDIRKTKKLYNERGLLAATGKDLCDCLDEACPGCHYPCVKCSSSKCGHDCRVNRNWMVEKIEIEGNDFVVKNVYKKK